MLKPFNKIKHSFLVGVFSKQKQQQSMYKIQEKLRQALLIRLRKNVRLKNINQHNLILNYLIK